MSKLTPRRLGALLLVVLAMLTGVCLFTLQPPAPQPTSAPNTAFSAARALADARVIGDRPHPIGSASAAHVRDYLRDRLTALGGTVTRSTATVAVERTRPPAMVGTVHDLYARFTGVHPTGRVLLVAHYDSVPAGPGASDDAANVAAVLEIVRALRAKGPQRNEVDVLFTDGEETGLLGSRAFVSERKADPRHTVVLNLEARGVSGPSVMFESGQRNSGLLSALGTAGRPVATSLADEVYRFLPNDTDLSTFKHAGFTGLNFAFVDGSVRYHTAGDTPARISAASVQHQGSDVLAVAGVLAAQDLRTLGSRHDTYFSVPGTVVHYPQALGPYFSVLSALGYAATVWYACRRGVRRRGVLLAAGTFPLALVAVALLGVACWALVRGVHPGYGDFPTGDSYRPLGLRVAWVVLAGTVVLGWGVLLRRRVGATQLALGVWGWFAVLAVVTGFLTPGASYLLTWPLLIGCVGLCAALRGARGDDGWCAVGASVAALPACVLLIPPVVLIFPTLGLSLAAAPMVCTALLVATALPLTALLPRRVGAGITLLALATSLAITLSVLPADGFDGAHPQQTSLSYVWDADSRTGYWVSADAAPPSWTRRKSGTDRHDLQDTFATFPPIPPGSAARRADDVAPTAPTVTITPAPAGPHGERTVRVHIAMPAGTSYVSVSADVSSAAVASARVLGATVAPSTTRQARQSPWTWGFVVWTVPADGIDVFLRVHGGARLPLRVTSYRQGLPPGTDPMPKELTWSTWGSALTDVTAAGRTVRI